MNALTAVIQLSTTSRVGIESTQDLVDAVKGEIAKLAARRASSGLPTHPEKVLTPVEHRDHGGHVDTSPLELLHKLGVATILAGTGTAKDLTQHWACVRYLTTLESNGRGGMQLSRDGMAPSHHRRSVQAEDLGIAFALVAAERIAEKWYPGYQFTPVDADHALSFGYVYPGIPVSTLTRARPDYFLVGWKFGAPIRVISVECKGSHGSPGTQITQLATASTQVNSVVIGAGKGRWTPPGLIVSTALTAKGGIRLRLLDPPGNGNLGIFDGGGEPPLEGPIERQPIIGSITVGQNEDSYPGYYIAPERVQWFTSVLARTAAAGLLAFVGDLSSARSLLPEDEQALWGETEDPEPAAFDTVDLAGSRFVGTSQVFRIGTTPVQAFYGMPRHLHARLADRDFYGWHAAATDFTSSWSLSDAVGDWGGQLHMDAAGTVMGVRELGTGNADLRWSVAVR